MINKLARRFVVEEKLIKIFKNYFGEINSNEKYFVFEYEENSQIIKEENKYLIFNIFDSKEESVYITTDKNENIISLFGDIIGFSFNEEGNFSFGDNLDNGITIHFTKYDTEETIEDYLIVLTVSKRKKLLLEWFCPKILKTDKFGNKNLYINPNKFTTNPNRIAYYRHIISLFNGKFKKASNEYLMSANHRYSDGVYYPSFRFDDYGVHQNILGFILLEDIKKKIEKFGMNYNAVQEVIDIFNHENEYVNSLQDSIYNFNKYLRENEPIKLVKNK